jgi:hypothetical protein
MSAIGNYVSTVIASNALRFGGRRFEGLSKDEGQEEFVKNLCASPFNEDPHWMDHTFKRAIFSLRNEYRIQDVFCIRNKRNFNFNFLKSDSHLHSTVFSTRTIN